MKTIKCIISVYLFIVIMMFGACQKEEIEETKKSTPLETQTELFSYEGTAGVDVIAVDEEGYLYTATCITDAEEVVMVDGVIQPVTQQFNVYDLDGNLVQEKEVAIGTGNLEFLKAEGETLYCIAFKSYKAIWGPTLYTIDTKTWEVEEVYCFENYSWITNFAHVGDYFYVIGQLKEAPEKEYTLHPEINYYTYQGECVSRIKVGAEVVQEEIISVEFPIDMVGTSKNTILIYHYNEENGFGFLEFHPEKMTLEEVGWTESMNQAMFFTQCESGFVFMRNGILRYGTVDNVEAVLSGKQLDVMEPATYQRGFLFYQEGNEVQRIGVINLIKENTPIYLLSNGYVPFEPYDNGYLVKKKEVESEEYTLKVLARDTDFDMYILDTRSRISYNMKEKGAFYALNDVEGVQEYLDACFPYLKESAMNEDGDIWMIPIGNAVSILGYHRIYSETKGVDLDSMDYLEFLNFVEEVETEHSEEGSISTHVMVEELFKQYLSVYDTFDTDVFRDYAKKMRQIEENVGTLYMLENYINSVRPTTIIGVTDTVYTEEQLNQIPNYFYDYDLYMKGCSNYIERLGSSDMIGVTGVPNITKGGKNGASVTFLCVNPQSKNLKVTLDYISDLCKYMLKQENTFLLKDEEMYTDVPFVKECYDVYKNGTVFFFMDSDVYWNPFWDYIEGEMELEEMIEEIERKRSIYVGE